MAGGFRFGGGDIERRGMMQATSQSEQSSLQAVQPSSPQVKRPGILPSRTDRYRLACGNLYVTITYSEGKPYEVFVILGRAGNCTHITLEAIGKLCSTMLRAGLDKGIIIDRLEGLRCPSQAWNEGKLILSCPDAIAQSLTERVNVKPIEH